MKDMKVYCAGLCLEVAWKELEVFSKLLVRGRNQHRRDRCYHMLVRVCKDLKRYQRTGFVEDLRKCIKRPRIGMKLVKHIASRASTCSQFTDKLLPFLEKTFLEVERQLHMGLFIPVNLLMLSAVSRLWYLLHYHSQTLSEILSRCSSEEEKPSAGLGVAVARTESKGAELPKTSLARELPNKYTGGGQFGSGSIAMESNTLFNKYTEGRQVESEGTIEPRPALTPSKCVIAGELVSGGTGFGLVPPSTRERAFESSEPLTPDAVKELVTPDAVGEPTHDSERTAEQVTTPGDGHPTEVVTPGNEPPEVATPSTTDEPPIEVVTPSTADEPPIDVVTPSTADEPPIEVVTPSTADEPPIEVVTSGNEPPTEVVVTVGNQPPIEVVTPGNKPPIEVLGNEPPIEVVTLSTADEPHMEVEPHSLTGNDSVAATPVSFGAQVANLRRLKGRVRMVVEGESRIFEMRVSRHTYGAPLVPISVRIQSMRKTSVFAKWHTISKGVVTFKLGGVRVLQRTKSDCRLEVKHRIGCRKQGRTRTDSKRKNGVKQRIYRADRIWKQGVKHRTWHRIRKQVVKHRIRKQVVKHRIRKQRVNRKHGVKHRIQQRTIENNYYRRRGVPLRSQKDMGKDSTNLKNDHRLKSPEDMSELPLASKKSKPEYSTMDIIDELFSTV